MGKSSRYRKQDPGERRRNFGGRDAPGLTSLWRRADCCGATIAADPDRMRKDWADVHEAGCRIPWNLLGLDGAPREVYPGAAWLPDGARLRAVNRKAGSPPANREHSAAHYRRPA